MIEAEPGAEREAASLRDALEGLSGRFGELRGNPHDYAFSNDLSTDRVFPELRERMAGRPAEGVGLFVGPGNMPSLLPELRIETPVMVDVSAVTTELSRLLRSAIIDRAAELSQCTGEEFRGAYLTVCDRMLEELAGRIEGHPVLADVPLSRWTASELHTEAWQAHGFHWSDPALIERSAAALAATEPAYVQADLTNQDFIDGFATVCAERDTKITFANFTNVHEWIEQAGGSMSFLHRLPFAPDAVVLYSVDERNIGDMDAKIAGSLEEYLAAAAGSSRKRQARVAQDVQRRVLAGTTAAPFK